MAIHNKKSMFTGLTMAIVFAVVLVAMFLPLFDGGNAFSASDKLFNTISKGSTYYIPMLRDNAKPHMGASFDGTINVEKEHLQDIAKVLSTAGATVTQEGDALKVSGKMSVIYEAALADSDAMFANEGKKVSDKYGIHEKNVLYAWWNGLKALAKALDAEKRFAESAYIGELISRGVEVGYNYYTIEPQKAADRWLIITSALLFYVLYTLWWGYAIYFLFEGIGLQLTAGHKKES